MNPLNSNAIPRRVSDLKIQLETFSRLLRDDHSAESNHPLRAIYRSAAQTFSVALGNDATLARAIDMLQPDPTDGIIFWRVASELLEKVEPATKILFVTQIHHEKTDFGLLCAFVTFQLCEMLRTNPELYHTRIQG